MEGFFSPAELNLVKPPASTAAQCGLCGLYKTCRSPKMPPSGKGQAGVLLVGEAPGKNEDLDGRQFVGKTGQLLEAVLAEIGVSMRRQCRITNAIICRPPGNVFPSNAAVDWCRPNLTAEIKSFRPKVIIPLGSKAIKAVLGPYWHDPNLGGAKRWSGYRIPLRKLNAWVCPTYHPSYVEREFRDAALYRAVFKKHLAAAFELDAHPWEEIPDYESKVDLIYSDEKAEAVILRAVGRGVPCAFDYETDRLKPDRPESCILAASICQGARAFAFVMGPAARDAMRKFLKSDVPKISHNAKFEERWSRRVLKTRVRNWHRDTMLDAHIIDCRTGTSSLKFQALVHFGMEDYNSHLEKLLQSGEGGNGRNDIRRVDTKNLLLYCGLDSLFTHELARLQGEILGEPL